MVVVILSVGVVVVVFVLCNTPYWYEKKVLISNFLIKKVKKNKNKNQTIHFSLKDKNQILYFFNDGLRIGFEII